MKKFISLCAVLCVMVVSMVGTAFAFDSDSLDPRLFEPPFEGAFSVAYEFAGHYEAVVFDGDYIFVDRVDESTGGYIINAPFTYYFFDPVVGWYSHSEGSLVGVPPPDAVKYLYITHDICDASGNVMLKSTFSESGTQVSNNVLSSSVSADSLTGILGEVLGLLVIALPVLVGLFGIRKGIAFLIGRIRGI